MFRRLPSEIRSRHDLPRTGSEKESTENDSLKRDLSSVAILELLLIIGSGFLLKSRAGISVNRCFTVGEADSLVVRVNGGRSCRGERGGASSRISWIQFSRFLHSNMSSWRTSPRAPAGKGGPVPRIFVEQTEQRVVVVVIQARRDWQCPQGMSWKNSSPFAGGTGHTSKDSRDSTRDSRRTTDNWTAPA